MRVKNNLVLISAFLIVMGTTDAFAADSLGSAKAFFLQEKYWQAIGECNALIRGGNQDKDILAQANYIAGVSYANLFDFLNAKKSFEVILGKYKGSSYYEDAYLGLGEIEFLQQNFDEALKVYLNFLDLNPTSKKKATVYFRLADIYIQQGDDAEYRRYVEKLKNEFPNSFEAFDADRLSEAVDFYTVQVGAFSDYNNAKKFIAELEARGYEVYSVLCMLSGKKLCRIRIGKFKTLDEARELKDKLELDGYFAKIFPDDK